MLDRGQGFVHNTKKILRRYPWVIVDNWRYDQPVYKKIFWTLFTIVFYFPIMFLVVLFELLSGAPFEGGCGLSLEDFEEEEEWNRQLAESNRLVRDVDGNIVRRWQAECSPERREGFRKIGIMWGNDLSGEEKRQIENEFAIEERRVGNE